MEVDDESEDKAKSLKSGRVRSGQARMKKLTPEERQQLARSAAVARWSNPKVANAMSNENSNLPAIRTTEVAAPKQGVLDLGIEKQIEIDGIGMGVLSDGTPFLTGRGLARLCGVNHFAIQGIAAEWNESPPKSRIFSIQNLLLQRGVTLELPYLAINQRNGTFYAYTDAICLAVLEYYAFDAGSNVKDIAKKNFRLLAGKALRDFIYTQVGYDPNRSVPDAWKQFHDRVSLTYNSVPNGYFSIFKEMADMIVTLGQNGIHIDSNFVPDISVGTCWSKYWIAGGMEEKYSLRIKYDHNYPNYFPQALSNPQEAWCYPDEALGEFRRWLRVVYIGEGRFAKYVMQKVQHKELPISFAQLAIAAYSGDHD
jgi:hypothetical protein